DKLKKNLLKQVDRIEKKIEKKKQQNAKQIAKMEQKLAKQGAKGKIDAASVDELTELLDAFDADDTRLDESRVAEVRTLINALDVKQNIKNNLLKRIDRLEQKNNLLKVLDRVS